jgi:hypothetical protein
MTKHNGEKVNVCCVTLWFPVPSNTAQDLELQCQQWRQGNLTSAERELAESLSQRLASHRAQLSNLLHQLPLASHGSFARDQLDEQISNCEEKIALYNELLKPIRLHAATKVDGLTEAQGMWLPRAYGLLGREEGFVSLWREWLRGVLVPFGGEITGVDAVSDNGERFLPLERYVVNMCGEIPLPLRGRCQVEIAVRELRYGPLSSFQCSHKANVTGCMLREMR